MPRDGIDEETGMVNVYEAVPEPGDSIMIVNCGDHFEIRHHRWAVSESPPLYLSEEDVERLRAGRIVWH